MGIFNALLGNKSEVTIENISKEFGPILIDGEHIEKAYKLIRNMFIFINKRLILVENNWLAPRSIICRFRILAFTNSLKKVQGFWTWTPI